MKKGVVFIFLVIFLSASFFAVYAEDIVILYTNDVHCGYKDNLGFSSLAALKDYYKTLTPNVLLVDNGDSIQGDVICAVSLGEFMIDFMNEVGYDYAIPGNHEFDYCPDRLAELADMADFPYLSANITYTGTESNKLAFLKPYAVHDFGDVKIGFVGVTTPETISDTIPAYFQENGKFVYDFGQGEKGRIFAGLVQNAVDACKAEGADYVILLSHLGTDEGSAPYRSTDIISKTHDIDACLDGHSHSVIPSRYVFNDRGERIPLSSAGTKLQYIGVLTITEHGIVTATIVSGDQPRSPEFDEDAAQITEAFEKIVGEVITHSNVDLRISDENGIRMVRSRETNLGDLVADAYRYKTGADIAMINGGNIRTDLAAGDLTYGDIIACLPFGNAMVSIKATGQQILDALEWGSRNILSDYRDAAGEPYGEDGGFLQVSGLRYTIDTSVESPVTADANGMFFGMIEGAPYRVTNVEVMEDGEWVPLDVKEEYTVGGIAYILMQNGNGYTMFEGAGSILNSSVPDYEVLKDYMITFNGDLSRYAEPQGRITIK